MSFDVNHRVKLWSDEEAARALEPMLQGVEILFCGLRDAGRLFSLQGDAGDVAKALRKRTKARHVVVSCGEEGAVARDGGGLYREPGFEVSTLDRLGVGDALAAGVIHGWLDADFPRGLRDGVALASLALSHYGDSVVTTADELRSINRSSSDEGFR